jgi:hypothetical protein
MSIPVTVLIYAGIPLGIILLGFAAVFLPGEMKSPGRYRPGRPWTHDPSWFLPHVISDAPPVVNELHDGVHPLAAVLGAAPARAVKAVGGASGEW